MKQGPKLQGVNHKSSFSYGLLIFLFSFALFVPYLVLPTFIDEIDNMVGGFVVSQGGAVYQEFLSQHTPFMYYLFSIYALFGAVDVFSFRLLFYVTLSICIALIATKFSGRFSKWVFVLWVTVYVSSFAVNPNLSYTSLATHLVALAVVFLLLQLLTTNSENRLGLGSWLLAGTVSMISIFSSFISIYPIFILSLALFFSQLRFRFPSKTSRTLGGSSLADFSRTLLLSALGYSVPFLLLLLIPILSGTFDDFIFQAFTLNTEIYSKYLGLGGDPWGAFWAGAVHFQNIFGALFILPLDPLTAIRNFLLPFGVYFLVGFVVSSGRVLSGIAILFTAFGLSIRGTNGFHSQQLWAFASMALVLALWYLYQKMKPRIGLVVVKKSLLALTSTLLVILSTTGLISISPSSLAALGATPPEAGLPSGKQLYIQAILEEDESFFQTGLDPNTVLISQRLPVAGAYGYVPWFEEALGNEIRATVFSVRPKLIFHNPDNSVWGYVLKEFDPSLNRFIETNYTKISPSTLEGNDFAWVRNDFLDEAKRGLASIDPDNWCGGYKVSINSSSQIVPMDPLAMGSLVKQSFDSGGRLLSGIGLRFGTYMRANDTEIFVSLRVADSMEEIRIISVFGGALVDNGVWDWRFEPLVGYEGEELMLVVETTRGDENNVVTLYQTISDSYSNGALSVNEVQVSGDLEMILRLQDESTREIPVCMAER